MFAKLLKHEWRATRGILALLCVIILVSGLTIGLVMGHVTRIGETVNAMEVNVPEGAMSELEEILCVLLIMTGIIAIAVCSAASLFYVLYRFYKRCFTDEGYLTFTLPVTGHQILLSSLTHVVISELIVFVAALGAIAIAGGMFVLALNQHILWADVWVSWESVWQQLWASVVKNWMQFAMAGFSGIFGALSEIVLLMLAVTLGALVAKKHKILAAVAVYYGIGLVESFVFSVLFLGPTTPARVNWMLAAPGLMGIVLAVGGYWLMHYLVTRKLNLT